MRQNLFTTVLAVACQMVGFLAVPGNALAGAANLSSGRYGAELALAVAPLDNGRLTGYFAVPNSPCRFHMHGLPHGEIYRLAILTPGDGAFAAYGELRVAYDGEVPVVSLDVPVPPNCQKAAPDLPGRGFPLAQPRPWTGVRLVSSQRAHFHDEPHDSTVRKAYVVKWDAVAHDKETPAFAHAEFLGGKSPVVGWVRQEDLFPADATPEMNYVRTQLPPMVGRWPQAKLPVDVRAYLNARERCEHFEGEEGTDAARQAFLAKAVARECGEASRRFSALMTAYARRAPEAAFLKQNAPSP